MNEKIFEKFSEMQKRLQMAQSEQFDRILEKFIGGKSVVIKSEEEKSMELYCKVKSLISEFQSDVEKGVTFESWYSRNKSYFEGDAQSLAEEVRVRLLLEKLGRVEYAKMSQKMLPKKLEEMNFESTKKGIQ